ncbi:hypothetical protein CspeluHIS016_0900580 [Cutaneotrichosporon spelunceum]|uniref:Uncharacterized protein n=1 Tax=Cutaneotrichosporon spelunceum TaxID=1672016 RepID=A0AAD3YE61_9TREE|nr:hypothetical protein CspeluHIS016_0900580 [Cutaneotrichosporon spelunceum]
MPPKRKAGHSLWPSPKKKGQLKKARAGGSGSEVSDDSLSPSFEDEDDCEGDDGEADDGLRGETLREIARLEADTWAKIDAMKAESDTNDRINAALDGMRPAPSHALKLRQMFKTRVNVFEDMIQSVSTGNAATTRAALEAAFTGAKRYYGETRPRQTTQAGEDARGIVRAAAEKANDGDAYHGAKAIVRAMRKQAHKTDSRWR